MHTWKPFLGKKKHHRKSNIECGGTTVRCVSFFLLSIHETYRKHQFGEQNQRTRLDKRVKILRDPGCVACFDETHLLFLGAMRDVSNLPQVRPVCFAFLQTVCCKKIAESLTSITPRNKIYLGLHRNNHTGFVTFCFF